MFKAISWITVAIGAVCTAMWAVTGFTGETGLDWLNGWMVGPILLVFVAPSLLGVSRMLGGFDIDGGMPEKFQNAPIGMGTVVSADRTGLSINDQPQLDILLDIDTPDGQSFRGMARQIIDLTELAAVVPGAMLPVRYIPGSSDGKVALATDASQAELQAAFNRVRLAKGEMTPRQLQIAEQGVVGRAVVLAMSPTGELRGANAVIDIKLRVSRPDSSTFEISQHKPIPSTVIPLVQPGMVVEVRYLPGDESEVSIVTPVSAS
ncbi:hypothetical protein FB566_5089 [Stackebrandtia endophytica]|uniref:Uncharacterized protein n=1 Tax=Stackebrandtia endophytica TaxID=1496996 RepID=A0A543B3R8_9ACTN|nr:hypothetical protein [Stackebrandtia endophytica]TQL79481.1 hypothetical protein FB566_5089 [Stackebrandtia endophytica]